MRSEFRREERGARGEVKLRPLQAEDCPIITQAFAEQDWNKPLAQYEQYLAQQEAGLRAVILAEIAGEFAGYLTIQWISGYKYFQNNNIPEVVDFNVLKKFQRRGIGAVLMDEAERRIKKVHPIAGIGVGVTPDYGAAHILYVKRGYIPVGSGLVRNGIPLGHGEVTVVLDDVAIYFTKTLF